MPFNSHPASAVIRRLRPSEAALASHLALASLWIVDLPDRSLDEINTLLQRLPSVSDIIAGDGSYFIAEVAGVVAAGGGWSPMPVNQSPKAARTPVISPLFFIDPEEAGSMRARLLARIESDIARTGHAQAQAQLIVPSGSASSYERLGYTKVRAEGRARGRLPMATLEKVLADQLAAVA